MKDLNFVIFLATRVGDLEREGLSVPNGAPSSWGIFEKMSRDPTSFQVQFQKLDPILGGF